MIDAPVKGRGRISIEKDNISVRIHSEKSWIEARIPKINEHNQRFSIIQTPFQCMNSLKCLRKMAQFFPKEIDVGFQI